MGRSLRRQWPGNGFVRGGRPAIPAFLPLHAELPPHPKAEPPLDHEYPLDSAEDHGGTISVYLRDPDGNGTELTYDLPRETWFDHNGQFILKNESFDPADLLVAERC